MKNLGWTLYSFSTSPFFWWWKRVSLVLPGKMFIKIKLMGISRAGQWLRLCAPNIGGLGLIPGQRTKILRATGHSQKNQPTNQSILHSWLCHLGWHQGLEVSEQPGESKAQKGLEVVFPYTPVCGLPISFSWKCSYWRDSLFFSVFLPQPALTPCFLTGEGGTAALSARLLVCWMNTSQKNLPCS